VVQDLEHGEIDYWSFDAKELLKSAKMKLRIWISKFSSFVNYIGGLFILKTKIEGIITISLVTDLDHVTNKIFVFDTKILKFWPQWVEISNEIVYKWRKYWNSNS
jgi:hypothetical protein